MTIKSCDYMIESFFNPKIGETIYYLTMIVNNKGIQFVIDEETYKKIKEMENENKNTI